MVVKLFDSGLKLSGLDVKPSSRQVDQTFFLVYTDEEKVDFRKEKPMTEFLRVVAENQTDCTGVTKTPYVFTVVEETPPDCTRVAGTPSLVQKK